MDSMCNEIRDHFTAINGTIMVVPGLPSVSRGVCGLMVSLFPIENQTKDVPHNDSEGALFHPYTHTVVNGIESQSHLLKFAMFSTECYHGKWISLFEIQLPDKRNTAPGSPSLVDLYIQDLCKSGLSIGGVHFHYLGVDPNMIAVHHQSTEKDGMSFAMSTVQALMNFKTALIDIDSLVDEVFI